MFQRLLLCAAALLWPLLGAAQPYPERPITFVVPQPAGGGADALARALAEEMGRRMGTTIVVDNKPGASGMLAANLVAHARPDGYTVLVANSTPVLILPFMFDKVPYDARRDFDFVTEIASGQLVLVTNPDVPAKNVGDFLAWCRQNRGKVNYGSFGVGTSGHLTAAYLSRSRDLDMTHVPFKGELPMIQELIGGRIAWGFTTYAGAAPSIQAGRLRVLAAVADQRLKELPDVPTMAQAGLPDPEFRPMGWFGMMAPAGVPAPVLARLEDEARKAIGTPALQARIQAFGMDAIGNSSADFRKDYESMLPVVERMVKTSGARME